MEWGWQDWHTGNEEGMATHSITLAWRIPWTEEPGRVTKSWTQLKWFSRQAGMQCVYIKPTLPVYHSAGKEFACNEGDLGSIPGLERSLGEGKGYPLQYPGLENSMDCIVYGVTKSQIRLSKFRFQSGSELSLCCGIRKEPEIKNTLGSKCRSAFKIMILILSCKV